MEVRKSTPETAKNGTHGRSERSSRSHRPRSHAIAVCVDARACAYARCALGVSISTGVDDVGRLVEGCYPC